MMLGSPGAWISIQAPVSGNENEIMISINELFVVCLIISQLIYSATAIAVSGIVRIIV